MKKRLGRYSAALAAALAMIGSAAGQLRLPVPSDAGERAILPEVGGTLGSGHATLRDLDALLAKLPRPSPLRGAVQMTRAQMLEQANRLTEATAAAEEAMRLWPDSPAPKLVLAGLLTFTGGPQRAADLWLDVTRTAPDLARETDRYLLDALIGRLQDMGDGDRARSVAARMGEIGLSHQLAPDRVETALAQLHQATVKGDGDGARRALADVASAGALLGLYADKRFEPLWPAIEQQGGPEFASAQRRYFTIARHEWQSSRDMETAVNYARLLVSVHEYAAVVILFAPMLKDGRTDLDDPHVWFLAPIVARAMAETGRREEARTLLRGLDTAASADETMRLNASGNLANLSFLLQRWDDTVKQTGVWLDTARRLGSLVNRGAVLQVSALRACALTVSGHSDAAAPLIADILIAQRAVPQPAFTLFLCLRDVPKARSLVIDRLADQNSRAWALSALQPNDRSGNLPEEINEARMAAQVRRDPEARAAANKVGRILPRDFANHLPEGFDPDGTDSPVRVGPNTI